MCLIQFLWEFSQLPMSFIITVRCDKRIGSIYPKQSWCPTSIKTSKQFIHCKLYKLYIKYATDDSFCHLYRMFICNKYYRHMVDGISVGPLSFHKPIPNALNFPLHSKYPLPPFLFRIQLRLKQTRIKLF